MARVAANQDRSEKLRTEYIYQQKIHVATRRTNGKLAREETAHYAVMPTTAGTKKDMVGIQGRYWYKEITSISTAIPFPRPAAWMENLYTTFATIW